MAYDALIPSAMLKGGYAIEQQLSLKLQHTHVYCSMYYEDD